jgi:hypothetical protein
VAECSRDRREGSRSSSGEQRLELGEHRRDGRCVGRTLVNNPSLPGDLDVVLEAVDDLTGVTGSLLGGRDNESSDRRSQPVEVALVDNLRTCPSSFASA